MKVSQLKKNLFFLMIFLSSVAMTNAQQTGLRQYEMADRYLKANRKRQASDLFHKAKDNMIKNKTKTNKLGLSYIKLASI